jgi:hypothetical protein
LIKDIQESLIVSSNSKEKGMCVHYFSLSNEVGCISNSKDLSPSSIQEVPKEVSQVDREGFHVLVVEGKGEVYLGIVGL